MGSLRHVAVVFVTALVGCADHAYDPSKPAIDPNAPRVHITSPDRGTLAGNIQTIEVRGNVTDDGGPVESVTVNDVSASVASDGTFTVTVPVTAGTNLLHAVAKDKQGNVGKESRAVVAGPMATLARQIPDSITATLSAQTFDAIGRGAAGFIKSGNVMTTIAPMNPVARAGDEDGPDCLYGQAHITKFEVSDATLLLAPQNGGLQLSAQLDNPDVGMYLQWAVACADGSRDITVSASKVLITGTIQVGIVGRNFDIKLVNPQVTIQGFNLQLGGIPQEVIDMLRLNTAMGPILAFAVEKLVVPMLNRSLAGLNETKTIDVLGTQVDVDVKPSQIRFTREGGMVLLDTSLRAKADKGSFVYVPNTIPTMDMSQGFQLAMADDAANQLLTSMWSAKGMDTTIDLEANGSYGTIGTLFDSVQLETKVPPYVDASGDKLVLTVGDMLAQFKLGTSVTTAVAINAKVELKAVADSGTLRLDVGTPTVYVDILDQDIEGANQLSNAEFEAIVSFALSRIVAVGSGSVGAIPLPAIGGVAVTTLSAESQHGYLVVNGEVQ